MRMIGSHVEANGGSSGIFHVICIEVCETILCCNRRAKVPYFKEKIKRACGAHMWYSGKGFECEYIMINSMDKCCSSEDPYFPVDGSI
jgi:hypothetical protein